MSTVIALVALLLLTPAALAGGWAVATLDALPTQVRAGETLRLGFMVRQHGRTPTNQVRPYLEAYNLDTGEVLRVEARQSAAVGHFVLELNFPCEGTWEWSIVPEPFAGTELGTLTVLPPLALPEGARRVLRGAGLALLRGAGGLASYGASRARRAHPTGSLQPARGSNFQSDSPARIRR